MKKLLAVAAMMLIIAAPVLAATASKVGTPVLPRAATPGVRSAVTSVFEYNTAGSIDYVPEMGGSATGWAEWTIAFLQNNTGQDLCLTELSWPCSGPPSGPYGWIVFANQTAGYLPGPADFADYYGPYTPVDPNPNTFPPTTYTYIDVSSFHVPWTMGEGIYWGFDNTGMQGMTYFNGVDTWGWYLGAWDADGPYGRTCVMQLKADPCQGTPTKEVSWSKVKNLYR